MLATDRGEFETQLATLCAGFNVPIGDRLEAFWRGLAKMELRTFVRVVELCLGEDGPEKMPTTRHIWTLSKALRARTAVEAAPSPQWKGDKWDIESNHLLRAHVRNNPYRYVPDSHYDPKLHQVVPGPRTRACTEIIVRWKKTWAEDMRVETAPSGDVQLQAWRECMQRADEQIAQLELDKAA